MKSNKSLFSLIELLIVVAIIIILISLIQPALRKAIDQAYLSVCINNNKNLFFGWMAYSEDWNGNIPGAHDLGKRNGRNDWVDRPINAAGIPLSGRAAQTASLEDRIRGLENGVMFEYMSSTAKAFNCPVDEETTPMDQSYRSYNLACNLNGAPYCRSPITNTSQIDNPSGCSVFVEEDVDPGGTNWGGWLLPCNRPGVRWWDPIAVRHFNGNTIGYADGHVSFKQWQDPSTINDMNFSSFYLVGNIEEGGDLHFMRQQHQHKDGIYMW